MASSINASLSAGLVQTADTSGNLNIQSAGTTIVAVTSTGAAVTGTLSASGAVTGTSFAGALNGSLGATTPSTVVATTISASGAITAPNLQGPAFSAYAASPQTITGGGAVKVLFGTEEFDTNNNFASSRFTPTVAGYYQVNAQVYTSTPQSRFLLYLFKNGVGYKTGNDLDSSAYASTMGTLVYMNGSTDYLEVYVYFSTTANANANIDSTWFNGAMVRGA